MSIDDLKALSDGHKNVLDSLVTIFWDSANNNLPDGIIESSYTNLFNGYQELRKLGYDIKEYAPIIRNATEKMEVLGYRK